MVEVIGSSDHFVFAGLLDPVGREASSSPGHTLHSTVVCVEVAINPGGTLYIAQSPIVP